MAVHRATQVPKNFPVTPARYPLPLFRLEVEATRRYMFEGEIKDALTQASIPLDVLTGAGEPVVNNAQVAHFMQQLREVVGDDEKTALYGREAFQKVSPLMPRLSGGNNSRSVSSSDKLFLRVREAIAVINKQYSCNYIIKWHGGAEADIFEDTGRHCYGYAGGGLACATITGFLEEGILYLSGIRMAVIESECMANGALACRWHCRLA